MRWELPWMLLLLLVIPVLWRRGRASRARPSAVLWVRAGRWGGGFGRALLRGVGALPWVAMALAIVALARPQQGVRLSEKESKGVDIVLAIDVSPSMMAEDFRPKNRLHVAKETARTFVRQRTHDRIALVGFAGTAFTQCPLTLDHDAVVELLDALDFGLAESGTAVGMGLATSVARLRESRSPSRIVVLLTDGESNRGAIDPLTGAELARALGVKVYTVLVGRGGLVPVPVDDPVLGRRLEMMPMDVDETSLREIARVTAGRFFRAQDPQALAGIYDEIDRLERVPIRAIEFHEYHDLGPYLLGAAAAVMALHALLAATWAFRLP
jgi:Ca-activated chloride channel family protein